MNPCLSWEHCAATSPNASVLMCSFRRDLEGHRIETVGWSDVREEEGARLMPWGGTAPSDGGVDSCKEEQAKAAPQGGGRAAGHQSEICLSSRKCIMLSEYKFLR